MRTTTTIDVEGAPDEVFAFLADARNNPTWQKGMHSCTWTSDGPIGVGSTYDQVASMAGRAIRSSFVVEAFAPGRSITIQTTESTFPIRVTRSVEPIDGGARVTAVVEGGPTGLLARLVAPLLDRMVTRSIEADYRRLREHVARA